MNAVIEQSQVKKENYLPSRAKAFGRDYGNKIIADLIKSLNEQGKNKQLSDG